MFTQMNLATRKLSWGLEQSFKSYTWLHGVKGYKKNILR